MLSILYLREYYTSGILNMEEYFSESPIILDRLPKNGVIFGLLTEDYMFRVVRENFPVIIILYSDYF